MSHRRLNRSWSACLTTTPVPVSPLRRPVQLSPIGTPICSTASPRTSPPATGHRRAVSAANAEVLRSYWAIGREILNRQNAEGWGTKVIDRLSTDLKSRFPAARGYSPRNLKYMRAFAAAWPDRSIVQSSVAQLPWRHHLALLDKLDDTDLRLWYAAAAVEHGWSRDVLALQIESGFHRRSGKAVTNFATAIEDDRSDLAQQATRDPYPSLPWRQALVSACRGGRGLCAGVSARGPVGLGGARKVTRWEESMG